MAFNTRGSGGYSEKMRIMANGNVGIGTASPAYKLDVRDGIVFAGRAVSDDGSISYTNTAAVFSSRGVDHDAARSNVLRLMRDGTSAVQYAGMADFDLESWESSGVASRTAMTLKLGHGNLPDATDVMTWRSNGNVGIGTATPAAKLHVKTSGADGIVLDQDTGSTNNSSRLFFNSTSGNWAVFNNSGMLNFQSGAAAGSTSGNYTDFQLTTTGAICRRPFTVEANNLNISSGYGINFSASANTAGMTSEVLDDYEEGTWTPDLKSLNGSSVTHNTGTTKGYYTKIGDLVTVSGTIQWTSNGSNANGGYTVIAGLPYSCKSVTSGRCTGSFGAINGIADAENLNLIIDPGNQFIYITRQSGTTYYHSTTISASGAIYGFQITYRVG
jgi:hypothetical protein